MGVTSYYSFGGEIIGEETGGVRRDYLTDALGSVTATVSGAGAVENTYRYKPYGEQLAKTGAGSDPKFLWVGKWGYRKSSNISYVRSRHLNNISVWTSKDLLPDMINFKAHSLYDYCFSNPINFFDYMGLWPQKQIPGQNNPIRFWPPTYGTGPIVVYPPRPVLGPIKNPPPPRDWPYFSKPPKPPTNIPDLPQGDVLCANEVKKQIEHQYNQFFPPGTGLHNGPGDAFKHCMFAGLTYLLCGKGAYNFVVIGHELPINCEWKYVPHNWDPNEGPMDLHNNEIGRKCAVSASGKDAGSVLSCCLSAYHDGKLWMLPPSTWTD